MFNKSIGLGRRLGLAAGLLILCSCVGCGAPYYTVEGNHHTKYLVIHDGKEEIKINLFTGAGGNLHGVVDGDEKFEIEVDGVQMKGSVTPLGSVHFSKVVYKGKELGSGSWNDM